MLWAAFLQFALALYAAPFCAEPTVGNWTLETGAGVIGAVVVGVVARVVALFAAPAAVTGCHVVLRILALLVPSEVWRHVFAAIGGLTVGASAAVQLAAFARAGAQQTHVTVGRPDAEFNGGAGPDQPRLPSSSVARLPAPSSGSRG